MGVFSAPVWYPKELNYPLHSISYSFRNIVSGEKSNRQKENKSGHLHKGARKYDKAGFPEFWIYFHHSWIQKTKFLSTT